MAYDMKFYSKKSAGSGLITYKDLDPVERAIAVGAATAAQTE